MTTGNILNLTPMGSLTLIDGDCAGRDRPAFVSGHCSRWRCDNDVGGCGRSQGEADEHRPVFWLGDTPEAGGRPLMSHADTKEETWPFVSAQGTVVNIACRKAV